MNRLAVAMMIMLSPAIAWAQNSPMNGAIPNLDARDILNNGDVNSTGEEIAKLLKLKSCEACQTPGYVENIFGKQIDLYGVGSGSKSLGTELQIGSGLDSGESMPIIVGLRAVSNSIGLLNTTTKRIEISVSEGGVSKTYSLGSLEIVTIECSDCLNQVEVSIDTTGITSPFRARFAGGTIVTPRWDGTTRQWNLSSLH